VLPKKVHSLKLLVKPDSAKNNSQFQKLLPKLKKRKPRNQRNNQRKLRKRNQRRRMMMTKMKMLKKKSKNPLDDLPKSPFVLFDFKTLFVNAPDKLEALDFFWKNYDANGYSLYWV